MAQQEPRSCLELSLSRGIKAMIYSRSGIGKTMLAATAPDPIILAAEPGLLSLSAANQKRVFGKVVDIPVYEVTSIEDMDTYYEWFADKDCPYKSIFFDSATEIAERILAKGKTLFSDPRQAYGAMIDDMVVQFKKFRDIDGKHVFFLAKEAKLGDNADSRYGPAFPGQVLANAVPYLFDEVFHMAIGKAEDGSKYRFLQTQPDLQFDAKDRSGALDEVEEPNLTNIISKIQQK